MFRIWEIHCIIKLIKKLNLPLNRWIYIRIDPRKISLVIWTKRVQNHIEENITNNFDKKGQNFRNNLTLIFILKPTTMDTSITQKNISNNLEKR